MNPSAERPGRALVPGVIVALIVGSFLLVLNFNGARPGLLAFLKHEREEPGARDDRADFHRLGHLGDRGAPPAPDALTRALRRHREFSAALDRRSVAGVLCGPPGAPASDQWTWLGPRTISGRTRALAFDPSNPDRLWAGTAGGGVWLSVDGASSWSPTAVELGSLVVSSLVFDPTPPGALYVGTGESFQNGSFKTQGAGLFRLPAGRASASIPVPASGLEPGAFAIINKLAIVPDGAGGHALLVATETGLYLSRDPDRATWRRLLPGPIADVVVSAGATAGAARRILAGGRLDGSVHRSDDGGATFKSITLQGAGKTRVALAIARKNSKIVYALTSTPAPADAVAREPKHSGILLRSEDGGATFTVQAACAPLGTADNFLPNGYYASAVWAGDPEDENLVIVGGEELWRSLDGGASLSAISSPYTQILTGKSVHADIHAIVSHPNYGRDGGRRVVVGSDGGVYQTSDIRQAGADAPHQEGWMARNQGLGVVQIIGAAVVPGGQTIVAGTQDSGLLRYVAGSDPEPWSDLRRGGDGGVCAVDPHDPSVVYATLSLLKILRSTDGGARFERIDGHEENLSTGTQPQKPAQYSISDTGQVGVNFFSAFVLDPHRRDRLLAGGLSLWKTDTARAALSTTTGPRWESIKPPIDPPASVSKKNNAISAVAVCEDDPNVVWVGYTYGELFMTTDLDSPASNRWTPMTPTGVEAPTRMVTAIAIDSKSPQKRVYVTYGGYSAGNVRVWDEGVGWSTRAGNLPEVPARTLAIHPSQRDFLYVGTDLGLFCSADRGRNWFPAAEGPCQVQVANLIWSGPTLYAATHGRGLYKIDLRAGGK